MDKTDADDYITVRMYVVFIFNLHTNIGEE